MTGTSTPSNWYALRTQNESAAESALAPLTDEVFVPRREVTNSAGHRSLRPVIPRLMFMRSTEHNALELELNSRRGLIQGLPSFWIYRYQTGGAIQPITPKEMNLMRLLTADDTSRCEVYTKTDFRKGDHIRVAAGPFAGYEGYVRRIARNLHVIVEIEGVCSIALPFIHPDLLEKI